VGEAPSRASINAAGETAAIPPGVRTTLRVLAQIHAELASSRTITGSADPEHADRRLAPAS
jgi:hypothetical protein